MTYEYVCPAGHSWEIVESIADHTARIMLNIETTCPECGAPGQRVFSPTPVHKKGKGWTPKSTRGREDTDEGRKWK